MAKTAQETIWKRKVRILANVIQRRAVPIEEIRHATGMSIPTIQSDTRDLEALGIPVKLSGPNIVFSPMAIETLWENTDVGSRLHNSPSMNVKRRLAEAAVNYLRDREDPIKSVVFGSGVTAYRAAESLLLHGDELQVEEVFSSNVLVLFAFAYYKPRNMVLKVPGGQLDPATAWLQRAGIEQLGDRSVDAVVVSFMHLTNKGVWTRQPYELPEKVAHLKVIQSPFILIPIEWSKLAVESGHLVAPVGGNGEDAFDLQSGQRKYVILTDQPDAPQGPRDKDRFAVLDYWAQKPGIEIVKVPRTA